MKKTLAVALAFAMQFNAFGINALADSLVTYDRDTSVVNIKGSIKDKNKRITVEVLKPGITSDDLKNASAQDISNYIYTVRETVTDAEGAYEVEFKMEEATADYLMRIKSDKVEEITLKYVNSTEYKTALGKMNAQDATADTILGVIENSGTSLGLSKKYFDKLTPEEKTAVATEVLASRNELDTDSFTDYTELEKAYNTAVVIKSINSENQIDGTDILDEYAEIFELEKTKVWDVYNTFDATLKKETVAKMSAGDEITDAKDLRDSFVEYTVLTEIQNADTYSAIYDLINENNDVLNINLTAYNQLSEINKALVMQKIVGQSYQSANSLNQAIQASISQVSQSVVVGGGGGSSSGGGKKDNMSSAITIGVTEPKPSTSNNLPFSDIAAYGWAEDSIVTLYQKGIISGRGDGKFYPADLVKREEFVKMLVSGLNINQSETEAGFTDVDKNMWYAPYVFAAYDTGLVKGIDTDIFGVGRDVSRQDIAVFLKRAADYLNITLPKNKDAVLNDRNNISDYALDAVVALAEAGIINGNENGEFAPQKCATRAETARLIAEFLKYAN